MDRPLVLAHRGARRQAPENTVAAFRAARELGADGVELDVRRTIDGRLVVHHDPVVASGVMPAMQIDRANFEDLHMAAPQVPTLEEALDECKGLLVNIEIKYLPWERGYDRHVGELLVDGVLALLAERDDRVLISSFDLLTIDRVRSRSATLRTGYLFMLGGGDYDTMTRLASEQGHNAIHPDWRGLVGRRADRVIALAHDRGLDVNVWTVNRRSSIARLARLGVDGIVTDVPDVALAVL